MLRIEKEEIERTGGYEIHLIDTAMALDFVFDELEQEFGHRAAKRILKKTLKRVFRRKERSLWNTLKRLCGSKS